MSLLPVGTVLDGTYRIDRVVGEGGMGVVYEATHARLAGRYAVKVLLPNISRSPDALARFECEARVTSALQHPNVVQAIDHNTTPDGTEYLVMEYLAGESLAQRLARTGPLPLDAVVRIIDEIAAGLAAAHALGVVHRDLKPDNVFLVPVEGREHEVVKILDFGISKVSWVKAAEGELCGTPQYMAPEQVRGAHAEVDGATDQFALAAIAYEMLTGRNPFLGETLEGTFARVLREDPPAAGVNADVDGVLARGFAKAKGDRFATVTDFAEALRAAAAAADSAAEMAGEVSAVDIDVDFDLRPARRRSPWAVVVGLTLAAAVSLPWLVRAAPHRFVWARDVLAAADVVRSGRSGTPAPSAAAAAATASSSVVAGGSAPIVVTEIPHGVAVAEREAPTAPPPAEAVDGPRSAGPAKAAARPHRHRALLPPDEDATMGLDGSFGGTP